MSKKKIVMKDRNQSTPLVDDEIDEVTDETVDEVEDDEVFEEPPIIEKSDVVRFRNNESRPLSLFKGGEHLRIEPNSEYEIDIADLTAYPELANRFNMYRNKGSFTII